jgi:hypothetical protein
MVIAALVCFAILLVAWIVAPEHGPRDVQPMTEGAVDLAPVPDGMTLPA